MENACSERHERHEISKAYYDVEPFGVA
jgi:hypothetical protein